MSRHRMLLAALLLMPLRAEAQDLASIRAREAARLDSMAPLLMEQWQREQREVEQARRAAEAAATRMDTMRVGPITLLGEADDLAFGRRWIEQGWETQQPLFGSASHRIEGFTIVVTRAYSPTTALLQDRPRHSLLRFGPHHPASWQRRAAERIIGQELAELLPQDVRDWLAGAGIPAEIDDTTAYRWLSLATHSVAGRRCSAGEADGCTLALGLRAPGAQWQGWYTADDMRQIVRGRIQWLSIANAGRWHPLANGCVNGNDTACYDLFGPVSGTSELPPPMSPRMRGHFLTSMLRAYPNLAESLIAGTGTVTQRLEAGTGQPVDSLTDEWRRRILDAGPHAHHGNGLQNAAAMMWVAIFATLATRSTRWRVG